MDRSRSPRSLSDEARFLQRLAAGPEMTPETEGTTAREWADAVEGAGSSAGDGYSERSEEEEGFKAGREADPYATFAGHLRSGYDDSRRATDVDDEALAGRGRPRRRARRRWSFSHEAAAGSHAARARGASRRSTIGPEGAADASEAKADTEGFRADGPAHYGQGVPERGAIFGVRR